MFLSFGAWVVDLGFWDRFLNYPLEERLWPYAGSSLWPLATMPVLGGPVLGGPDG